MLDELDHFLAVVATGTFTAAAERVHLSQPALSASIARLEATLGARLFERDAAGARLTAAGLALRPRALAARAAVDEGQRAVREVLGLEHGEVRLGGGATVCTHYLPPLLTGFRARHPGLVLKLREVTTLVAHEGLAAGELDLCVISDPAGEPWRHDELLVVSAPQTRPAHLADANWITFPPGAATRELLSRHFPGARVVMELSGISAVLAFARAGVGVALVSRIAVESDLAARTLVVIPHSPIVRQLNLVHRGEARLPPAAAALRRELLAAAEPKTTTQRKPSKSKGKRAGQPGSPEKPYGARRSRRQGSPSPARR